MTFLTSRPPVNLLHLILGLIAAAPLVVLGATGALLVFETELDRALSSGFADIPYGRSACPSHSEEV